MFLKRYQNQVVRSPWPLRLLTSKLWKFSWKTVCGCRSDGFVYSLDSGISLSRHNTIRHHRSQLLKSCLFSSHFLEIFTETNHFHATSIFLWIAFCVPFAQAETCCQSRASQVDDSRRLASHVGLQEEETGKPQSELLYVVTVCANLSLSIIVGAVQPAMHARQTKQMLPVTSSDNPTACLSPQIELWPLTISQHGTHCFKTQHLHSFHPQAPFFSEQTQHGRQTITVNNNRK